MGKHELFKSNGVNRKIIYWISFLLINLLLAFLIVSEPVYFSFAVAALLLGVILFWKTRESLIALIFYLPFQIALNAASDIDLASSRIIIIALFAVWIVKALAKKNLDIPRNAISSFIFIFLGLAALSAGFSIDPHRSFIRLLYFFSIIPLYFISAAYLNSLSAIKKVFGALAASAALAALLGIAQFFGQFAWGINAVMDFMAKKIAPYFYGQSFSEIVLANPSWLVNIGGATYLRAISFFPDPHMFAFYLGLTLPLALTFLLRAGAFKFSQTAKIFFLIINILLFLALGFTFSRAGYIGAVFGISAVFVLNWNFLDKKVKLAVSAVSVLAAIILFSSPNAIINRFFDVFNPSEGSNSERLANWTTAVKIIEDHPLSGVGVGAYALAVDPRSSSRSPITAHNNYLDIAAEMGIGAFLAWIALLGLAARKLFKNSLNKNIGVANGEEIAALSAGLAGAFIWFSVQSVFDTAIYSPTLFALLMVYLAIAVNLGKINSR